MNSLDQLRTMVDDEKQEQIWESDEDDVVLLAQTSSCLSCNNTPS